MEGWGEGEVIYIYIASVPLDFSMDVG